MIRATPFVSLPLPLLPGWTALHLIVLLRHGLARLVTVAFGTNRMLTFLLARVAISRIIPLVGRQRCGAWGRGAGPGGPPAAARGPRAAPGRAPARRRGGAPARGGG